jgi:glucosylceramidase
VGQAEWIKRVQSAYPDVEMYWTEGGPDYKDAHYSDDWADWSLTFTNILRNCCRSITAWNLALDESGRPNIGPFGCGGLVTVHSQTKEVSYSGQFWAFNHYSRFLRRGARRFESDGTGDIHHVGFENPDGTRILVLTNPGPARTIQIRVGQRSASIQMDKNSISTLEWHS